MRVRIGSIPGRIETVLLEDGENTVEDAINMADLDSEGYDIKVNGSPATLDTVLNEGDEVILAKSVKGA